MITITRALGSTTRRDTDCSVLDFLRIKKTKERDKKEEKWKN